MSQSSSNEALVVFTAKSVETLLREGGTSSWRLDRNHARRCPFVVCTRNAKAEWTEGPETHHSAFLVAKIGDVVPADPEAEDGRFLVQFTEFARVDIDEAWKGDRNPVKYATLEELGIHPAQLRWEPMPDRPTADPPSSPVKPTPKGGLTIAEAKKQLGLTFGLSPESIEITIRG